MSEWKLFDTPPEWTTPEWYAERETAPHLEQEGHRERLILTAKLANRVIRKLNAKTVIDIGAGDGGLLSLIKLVPGPNTLHGFDLQATNVTASAQRNQLVVYRDVINDWPKGPDVIPDVILCTEFLEHLVDPHEFVQRLTDLHDIKAVVASSPYTETDEAHYDFHTWAWDLKGYRELFEDRGWRVTAQETAWISQVIVAER